MKIGESVWIIDTQTNLIDAKIRCGIVNFIGGDMIQCRCSVKFQPNAARYANRGYYFATEAEAVAGLVEKLNAHVKKLQASIEKTQARIKELTP